MGIIDPLHGVLKLAAEDGTLPGVVERFGDQLAISSFVKVRRLGIYTLCRDMVCFLPG